MTSLFRPSTGHSSAGDHRRPGSVLIAALGIAVAAAVSLVIGAFLPVVAGGSAGFDSVGLLVVLAVVPVVVAMAFALTGRHTAAAGLLIGFAVLAPGRLLVDLQLAVDSSLATRPELYLPSQLESPAVGAGLVSLLAGHVLTVAGGLFAGRFVLAQPEEFGPAAPGWRGRQATVLLFGTVAAVGLLMGPLRSHNVYLLARTAFEGPFPAWGGYLLLAFALPLAGALAVGSAVDGVARGALLGLGLGVFAVALPSLVAGLSIATLSFAPGPVVALIPAAGLIGASFVRLVSRSTGEDSGQDMAGEAKVPGLFRLRLATGGLGLLSAVAAFVGAWSAQLTSVSGAPAPDSPTRWLLLLSGGVIATLALLTMLPTTAKLARPVLSVVWVGVPLAGASVLGAARAATELRTPLYTEGPGVFGVLVAMVLAALTASCSMVTGVVEREDADLEGPRSNGNILLPLVAGAILAVAAFGTPTFTAPEYIAPGLWSQFGTQSWGSLAALLTVLGAIALVPRSRPAGAAGLLLGATVVLALRAAELPLLTGQLAGAHVGAGFWLTLGCAVALVIGAVMAVAGGRETA